MSRRTNKRAEPLPELPPILREFVLGNTTDPMMAAVGTRIVEVNEPFVRLFGYESRDEMIGLSFSAVVTPDSFSIAKERVAQRKAGKPPTRPEVYAGVRKDGERIPVEGIVISWPGDPSITVAVARDVTERVRRLDSLRESEELYRTLAETMPAGVLMEDRSGRVFYANQQMVALTGYSVEELMRGVWLLDSRDKSARSEYWKALKKGTSRDDYQAQLVRKDGGRVWASISWRPIPTRRGGHQGIVTTFVDVTERMCTEEALRESEERYRVLAENASDLIWQLDLEGRYTYVSPSVSFSGYEPEELIGHKVTEFTPPEERAAWLERFEQALKNPGNERYLAKAWHKDGRLLWREVSRDVICENGVPVRVQGISRDITERVQAEEALRESEERFRTLVGNIPGAVMRVAATGEEIVDYASDGIESITGYPASHFVGRPTSVYAEMIHPADFSDMNRTCWPAIDQGRAYVVQYRIQHRDGSTRTVRARGQAVLDDAGNQRYLDTVIFDVTELHIAEEALRESEEKYRGIVENTRDLIMLHDASGGIVYLSPACSQVLGWEPEEVAQKQRSIVHPEDDERTRQAMLSALAGSSGSNQEYRVTAKSGEVKWISHSWSPIMRNGRVSLVVSVVRDVTERRAAEAALQEAEERYRLLAENASDIIWQMDANGVFVYVSQAVRQYGYEVEEWVGHDLLGFLPPEEQHVYLDRVRRDMVVPGSRRYEVQMLRKDGSRIWMEVQVNVVSESGAPARIQGIARDISERKRAEEQLREAHADLQKAYQIQREFLNNVTHEIRTPMTAVKGYVEMLLEGIAGPLNEKQAALMQKVLAGSDSLVELVSSLLEVARLRTGRVAIRSKACKPGIIAGRAVSSVTPQATKKGLTIDLRILGPDRLAMYDEEKVLTILHNLLTNAVKFTSRGRIEVQVKSSRSGFEMIIADTGIGIRQKDLGSIFDEFQQLDYPRRHKPPGFGLGLSIVANMVELLGATLVVSSRWRLGTAFTVSIPKIDERDA